MSQDALAEALGLSQGAVSRRMLGKTEFSLTEIERAADLLKVPVETVLCAPPGVEFEPVGASA